MKNGYLKDTSAWFLLDNNSEKLRRMIKNIPLQKKLFCGIEQKDFDTEIDKWKFVYGKIVKVGID